jgi:hypothetical protein
MIMSRVDEAEKFLAEMSPAEKAQLLQRIVRDLGDGFPGIEETPGVCGGVPRIVRTRIPVWVLEQARRLGASEAASSPATGTHAERLGPPAHRVYDDGIDVNGPQPSFVCAGLQRCNIALAAIQPALPQGLFYT